MGIYQPNGSSDSGNLIRFFASSHVASTILIISIPDFLLAGRITYEEN